MLTPRPPLLAMGLVAVLAAATASAAPIGPDAGRYAVMVHGKPVGTEDFTCEVSGDSVIITAKSTTTLAARGPDGAPLVMEKKMAFITDAFDFGLRTYLSDQVVGGDSLMRGVEPTSGDTLFSVYRQDTRGGSGDRLVLPPGRLFIVDSPPLFATFAFICRTLNDKSFDHRPISLFVLGERDSLIEATVSDLGHEVIQWGARPVTTRKLRIADANTEFLAWVSPAGQMLRFEQPAIGLRVERRAAAVRPVSKRRAG